MKKQKKVKVTRTDINGIKKTEYISLHNESLGEKAQAIIINLIVGIINIFRFLFKNFWTILVVAVILLATTKFIEWRNSQFEKVDAYWEEMDDICGHAGWYVAEGDTECQPVDYLINK